MARSVPAALAALAGAALTLPGALAAQVPWDGCVDRRGRPVENIVDNKLGWAGTAAMRAGQPVILWNEKRLGDNSGPMRLFVYLHECAHHALGHIWRPQGAALEREADCWAFRLLVDGGMARGRHITAVEREARQTIGDDIHLGGEARVESLRRCIREGTDRRAWRAALDTLAAASADSFAGLRGRPFPGDPPGVVESLTDVPGTFDCEVRPAGFACTLFASRQERDVTRRFEHLLDIVRGWLPGTWTSVARGAGSADRREFHAEDSRSGAGLSMVATEGRITFRFRPRQY